jgi:hypothetical protein
VLFEVTRFSIIARNSRTSPHACDEQRRWEY